MKHAIPTSHTSILSVARSAACCALVFWGTGSPSALGQLSPPQARQPQIQSGNRVFNPYETSFQRAWTAVLNEPVKLIEIGPVTEDKRNNLLFLEGGRETTDYRRKLIVTHWDGNRFVPDTTNEFLGTALDALLIGHFRATSKPVLLPAAQTPQDKDAKGRKKPKSMPTSQIVTTEGVYTWNGSSFTRLFSSPPNLRLSLVLDGTPDQLIMKNGDASVAYEAGETDTHPSAFLLNIADPGYARMAIGTQPYEGSKDFAPNVRYMQSFWQNRSRWIVGLERGRPAPTPDDPNATTGDRLVVYTPKLSNREKSFWQLTRADEYDEMWKSDTLTGRVLDVRVGDPKNEGKDGILVLTAENNTERRLTFFVPTNKK